MACVHLRQLYDLCQENQLSFSSSDLVRIVCKECESAEVCPSTLVHDPTGEEPTSSEPNQEVPEVALSEKPQG